VRTILCALLLTSTLTACGARDDTDDDAATETSTSEDTSTTAVSPQDTEPGTAPPQDTAPTQDLAADQALAESIVLTAADAPAGWTASQPDGDDDSEYDRRFAECVGVPVEHVDPTFPQADGADLTSPDDSEVTSTAYVAPSVEAAQPMLAVYRQDDSPACFTEVLQDVLVDAVTEDGTSGVTVDRPSFERLPYASLGDETEAFRLSMRVSAEGVELHLYADAILVRSGRVVVQALFMSLFEPFPVADSEALLRRMVDRIPAGA
jgi:hypothetical protein